MICSTTAEYTAEFERISEGMTLPATTTTSASISIDIADAQAKCIAKLTEYLTGEGSQWTGRTTCAIFTNPEAEKDFDRWTIAQRQRMPHDVIPENIVWSRYNHGGPRLQASYYFEWDGETP